MQRIPAVTAAALCLLSLSHCVTDVCGCTPAFVPAFVVRRVLGGLETPVQGAQVRAYSAGSNCHSLDSDFGSVLTDADGSFAMGLAAFVPRDSVCVFVFARPPAGAGGLENSDTVLLVMDLGEDAAPDSAQVELVLHSIP